MSLDKKITCAIHDQSHKISWLDKLAIFIARDFSFILIVVPLLYVASTGGYTGFAVAWWMAWVIVIAVFVQFAFQKLIKRDRPYQKEQLKPLFRVRVPTRSFPSGHATMLSALLYTVIATGVFSNPFILWFVIIGIFLVLLSRIYAGLHYVSDIIVGLLLGYGVGYLFGVITLFL